MGWSVELGRVRDLLDDGGPAPGEHRVLVDRLWPRGVAKDRLVLDAWDRDVAPSTELRRAYHHGGLGPDAFRARYLGELRAGSAAAELLATVRARGADRLVLVYASRDVEHNHALVLRERLQELAGGPGD